jgi:isopenicillin-N epimerase
LEGQAMEFLIHRAQPLIDRSRQILCDFVGADTSDLVFVANATSGVNAVVRSLNFLPGDEILTTSHEYNACRNVADYVTGRAGAKVVEVPLPLPIESPEQIIEAVMSRVTSRTKLMMLDHITSPTAIVFPVEEIVRRLNERKIDVLIDGAHAPGMVPLNLRQMGVAYYTGNCHKWLCAPKSAGFLYVRPDRQEGIMPPVIGHGYNKSRPGYTHFQDLFDWPGTFDPSPWICVGRSIEFLSGLLEGGLPGLMRRNHELAVWARRMLIERLSASPICPETMLGSMAAVVLPFDIGTQLDETTSPTPTHWLYNELREKHGLEAVHYHYPAPPQAILRVSCQAYNAPEQYERLADVLMSFFSPR